MSEFVKMDEQVFREINDVKPTIIDHFVGQARVVNRIKVALEASWNCGTKIPHCLMQGSAGLGKTELAYIISKEMGCELHEQLAQNIKCPTDLHAFLLTPRDREVCLLDDIHELPPLAQTTLYRAMENQQIFLDSRRGKKSRPIRISNFTVIGATTDPQKLLQPLRDRFKLVLDFEHYSEDELELLIRNRTKQLGWTVEEPVFSMIAERGKGTPRIALRLLESIKLTASADNSDVLTVKHFQRTCQLEGIDNVGLCGNEIKYLQILYENSGSTRLNILASRLSLHPKNVSDIIERHLIRIGFVTKENSLRVLTQSGLEHLRKNHIEGD